MTPLALAFSLPSTSSWASSHLAAESHSTRYHWYSSLVQLICRTQWILNAKLFRDAGCMRRETERKIPVLVTIGFGIAFSISPWLGIASQHLRLHQATANNKNEIHLECCVRWSAAQATSTAWHEKSLWYEQKTHRFMHFDSVSCTTIRRLFYVCIFSLKVSLVCLCFWSLSGFGNDAAKTFWFDTLSSFCPHRRCQSLHDRVIHYALNSTEFIAFY